MSKLERFTHRDRNQRTGRYRASPLCDGCGKPVGTNYHTDDDVCDGGDGPGFFLCERKSCMTARGALGVEERRALYTKTRSCAEAKRAIGELTPAQWRALAHLSAQPRDSATPSSLEAPAASLHALVDRLLVDRFYKSKYVTSSTVSFYRITDAGRAMLARRADLEKGARSTVTLPDGRAVDAVRCECGDGSCSQCDDRGMRAASEGERRP